MGAVPVLVLLCVVVVRISPSPSPEKPASVRKPSLVLDGYVMMVMPFFTVITELRGVEGVAMGGRGTSQPSQLCMATLFVL